MNSSPVDVAPAEPPASSRRTNSSSLPALRCLGGRHGPVPGFTCCQDPTLRNETSTLDERIDLIFTRAQPVLVRQALVILDDLDDRTLALPGQPRLWPSDHAGFEALLNFRGRIRPRVSLARG